MKLSEFSKYATNRERAAEIIRLLDEQPDKAIRNKNGRLNQHLVKVLPHHLVLSRNSNKTMNATTLNTDLNKMRDAGWVTIQRNGKRTLEVKLIAYPDDWSAPVSPQEDFPVVESTDADEDAQNGAEGLSDDVLGGRPGRIAARLEKHIDRKITDLENVASNMPNLIREGLEVAILNLLSQLVPAPQSQDEKVVELEQAVADLRSELGAEKLSHENTRAELNNLRRAHDKGTSSLLRVSDLPEPYREIGRHALAMDWKIERSGGGHIVFRSPQGKPYFASSTPSDYRSVKNLTADLYRMGLPRMP